MGDVNLQLVREFFELNVFRVLTNWQQDPGRLRLTENSAQLFVENTRPVPVSDLPFALRAEDIGAIERAVVEVRAWHGDRFYASVIESSPVLSQFVAEDSLALAREVFGGAAFSTILVVSELPATPEHRNRSISLLKKAGIEHIIEFPQILHDLLDKVNINGSYAGSETLQTLRLLKRYKFVRNQQMEFLFTTEPPATAAPPAEVAYEEAGAEALETEPGE
jgi:hypothetical protein